MDLMKILPNDLQNIVYKYLHQLNFRPTLDIIDKKITGYIFHNSFEWVEVIVFDYKENDYCLKCGNFTKFNARNAKYTYCRCDD